VVEGLARTSVRSDATDFGWLFFGRLALVGANAATMLLLARYLPLETYGLFVTVVGAQLLLSRCVLMGVDAGMLRLRALPDLRDRSEEVEEAGLAILQRAGAVLCLLVAGGAALGWVTGLPWPVWATIAVGVGAIGAALVDYGICFQRAHLAFHRAALFLGGTAALRLGWVGLALWLAPGNAALVFLLYAGTSLVSGLAQAIGIARGRRLAPEPALMGRLVRYSLWLGSADVIVVLAMHQGVFLLTLLGQQSEAGLFGLGMTLAQGFFLISAAFTEFVVPHAVRVGRLEQLPRFLKRVFGAGLILFSVCLLLLPAVEAMLPWVLHLNVQSVSPIFYCLSGAMLLTLLLAPVTAVAHYLQRPHLLMIGLVARVVSTGILGVLLIPRWGAMGAAAAHLGGVALGATTRGALVGLALRAAFRERRG
jgi:O-antigen/teichoic acid export membrane protein